MGLAEATQIYLDCKVDSSQSPNCDKCSLNEPLNTYSEQPTFCKLLKEIDQKYKRYLVPIT